ncbi:MAG: hypothetical protein QOE61_1348 [Micromonosporaceae bacterium]|jgi:uncharacterized protein YndB with AHSA1/START domain|nr:hypothetical protein [Micromonosporaceae bacterium]
MVPSVIERDILIEAPVDVVWDVVTQPEQVDRWFSDEAEIDVRPGGEGSLSWQEYGTVRLRVEGVDRPHLFSFRWVYPEGEDPREGNSLLVEFTLTAEGQYTRLRVVERGLAELDWSDEQKAAYVQEHNRGWQVHFNDLLAYMAGQVTTRR